MGSSVEIVFSLASNLLQVLNEDEKKSLRIKTCFKDNDLDYDFKYPALTHRFKDDSIILLRLNNLSANGPSPFDYVDEAVLLLWEHWKPSMLRTYDNEDQAWRYQPQQVCFVLSDVWRDGRWLQELMPGQTFGVYVYCWDGFGVWVEPKFLEYGNVKLA